MPRDSKVSETHFQAICQQFDRRVKQCKLNKDKLCAFLAERYGPLIAERVTKVIWQSFKYGATYDQFNEFLDGIAEDRASGLLTLKKLAFVVFDLNADDAICEIDVNAFLQQHLKGEGRKPFDPNQLPEIALNKWDKDTQIYHGDFQQVVNYLNKKSVMRGDKTEALINAIFKANGVAKVDGKIVGIDPKPKVVEVTEKPRFDAGKQNENMSAEDRQRRQEAYEIY